MVREGRDVISMCCMKNDAWNVVSDVDGMKNIWRKYEVYREASKCWE